MQLSGSRCHCAVSQTATVKMVVRGESGKQVCVSFCMTARDVCMCTLQPLEADGAEEEDSVQQNETQSQPTVQPPAVQMDTQHLRRERMRHFLLYCPE